MVNILNIQKNVIQFPSQFMAKRWLQEKEKEDVISVKVFGQRGNRQDQDRPMFTKSLDKEMTKRRMI